MNKTRVYELAKELGLENKALLGLCEQLGIDGKKSHSNSLSDGEAEKIRRFVIRSAVSDKESPVKELTREGNVLTEKRVGGSVIRRRKKSDVEAKKEPEKKIDMSAPSVEIASLQPDLARDKSDRNSALDAANALFKDKEIEQPEAVQEVAEQEEAAPEIQETLPEAVVAEDVEAEVVETAEVNEQEVAQVEQAVEAPAKQEASAEEATKENEANEEFLEGVRKRHGIAAPKVLGKIDLPQAAPKPTAKDADTKDAATRSAKPKKKGKEFSSPAKPANDSFDKRKRRKKQVLSKKQLIDYSGERDGWKSRRDRRGGKKNKSPKTVESRLAESALTKASKRVVKVDGQISVAELAKQLGLKAPEVMTKLMALGVMATINQFVDLDTATLVADEYGFTVQNVENDVESLLSGIIEEDSGEDLALRPPVVTVMGHVDHGKTSLLDAIRKTEVTESEFGGITQHIGAYNVKVGDGSVTFLDTPGHEAFTAMRSRGAQVTDIVVLVVAANDGVMPQTVEAINHAKAADVPIIVAVNKMDLEDAQPDKVIGQLAEFELVPEEWGGDTLIVQVSAHTRLGIDTLLENLHLQAEILELKASASQRAVGTVIESRIDKGRGPVISVLVQKGTLKKGDPFVAGSVHGRVRALINDEGVQVDEAGPSIPVEILGVSAPSVAGDDFIALESESQAREIANEREQIDRVKRLASQASTTPASGAPLTLESFAARLTETADLKELPLIVKADVQGSVEAVSSTLSDLSNEEVKVNIIHKAVGAISENDVQLASASGAIIVAFNVRPDPRASQLITEEGLDVLYSRVIYDLVDSVNSALKGKMAPKYKEKTLGHVEVRQTFKVPKLGLVSGCYVTDGSVERNASVRLLRQGAVVFEGKMASLRRFKDDVKEVASGYECGIALEGYSDVKEGDLMEVYKTEEIKIQ